ncbi:MAG: hypothetical protein K2I93_05825 [Oscillospiraceae bacterium]|nr:hypothetical protein [Oscillospiraceae bacterium]
MAIYLVDYENVYIDGLQGIDQLTEEDTLHIFYTQNRCGLTFGLYEQLISCKAKVELNEVSVSLKNGDPVKNALDIQLMMFVGYLIGSKRSEQLYVVSKDKDFLLGSSFFERFINDEAISLRLIPDITASFRTEEPETSCIPDEPEIQDAPMTEPEPIAQSYQSFVAALENQFTPSFAQFCDQYARQSEPAESLVQSVQSFLTDSEPEEPTSVFTVQYYNTVRNLLGKNTDDETITRVCEMISDSETLLDFNNALARFYRDGQRAKTVYHKFKPRFENLRHLSRAGRKR